MNLRTGVVIGMLSGGMLLVAGCATVNPKAPQPTREVASDAWITTKIKHEVRGASGVVSADAGQLAAHEAGQLAAHEADSEAAPDSQFDSDAEFGRRSLPFFPVFAIRPW